MEMLYRQCFSTLLQTTLVRNDDANLLTHNLDAVKKDKEPLIDSSKEVLLEVNAKKAKYMLINFDILYVQ
jgi:50S ribosomal subunit-associated GTPase HflX